MCTVTLATKGRGYLLAMNRDEAYSRASALPVRRVEYGDVSCLYPQEEGGGTWIGVNSWGVAFALLNWNIVVDRQKSISRGSVVPTALEARQPSEMEHLLSRLDIRSMWPFRMVGIFSEEAAIHEWRWDGARVADVVHRWDHEAWFSSGLSDSEAERHRRPAWTELVTQHRNEFAEAVRVLHSSHNPESPPFSICVHRENAGTLSYTEVLVDSDNVTLSYSPGAPCRRIVFTDAAKLPRLGGR